MPVFRINSASLRMPTNAGRLAARVWRDRAVGWLVAFVALWVLLAVVAMPLFLLHGAAIDLDSLRYLAPMILGSLRAAGYAVLFGVPLAVLAAIWCARFASTGLRNWIKPLLEIFEAIPSVVLGLVAALTLAPWFAQHVLDLLCFLVLAPLLLVGLGSVAERHRRLRELTARPIGAIVLAVVGLAVSTILAAALSNLAGSVVVTAFLQPTTPWNALLVGLVLGMALVPTVFSLAEDALFSVPAALADGAHALGASRWQAVWHLLLPAASPGLLAAVLLGFARALGETMIVVMASGNTPTTDGGPFAGLRSIAANLVLEAPVAAHGSIAYARLLLSALLLVGSCLLINGLAEVVRGRLRRRYAAQ